MNSPRSSSNSRILLGLACAILASVFPTVDVFAQVRVSKKIPFYIGTYTGGLSEGIYVSSLDLERGTIEEPRLVAKLANPSFLTIHPTLDVLYAVSEVGSTESQVVAYQIVPDHGLVKRNSLKTGGDAPCYISTDPLGKVALVANYGSGDVTAIALNQDGSLGSITSQVAHSGSSINKQRQEKPHAHCILTDPSNSFACAVDLGMDQVVIYQLDRSTGVLTSTNSPLKVKPGSGPRHLTFHPDGKHAFLIHELTSTLSSCLWNSQSGKLTVLDTASTLPDGFEGNNSTAEVLVHPSGKFVFGSNRGHDSIAAFRIEDDGSLTSVGHTPTGGKTPRNFRMDPSGQFMLTENQQSDSICVFRIDTETGLMSQVGEPVTVGSPCCIKFLVR